MKRLALVLALGAAAQDIPRISRNRQTVVEVIDLRPRLKRLAFDRIKRRLAAIPPRPPAVKGLRGLREENLQHARIVAP